MQFYFINQARIQNFLLGEGDLIIFSIMNLPMHKNEIITYIYTYLYYLYITKNVYFFFFSVPGLFHICFYYFSKQKGGATLIYMLPLLDLPMLIVL